jgi:tetratricopeptide (TPR) repeat protein
MKPGRGEVAVFFLALLIRAFYLWELDSTPLLGVLLGDGRQYHSWATQIAGGEWLGHEVYYQAPLYPYFMAVVLVLLGPEPWGVRVVQIVLGSLASPLLSMAGRRFFDRRIGLAAGTLLAVYPPAIFFDGLIQKTSLGLFLMCLLLLILGQILWRPRGAWFALAGVVLGALALTRENALAFAPVLVLWVLLHPERPPWDTRLRRAVLLVAGLLAVLVPVGLRNRAVGGEFLITTSQLGPNFYIGNNLRADGRYTPLREAREDARVERTDARELAETALGRSLTPAEVSDYWLRRSFDEIASDPARWLGLLLRKGLLVWNAREVVDTESIEAYQDHSRLLSGLSRLLHFGILLPLAALGVFVTRHRWRHLWILYAVTLTIAASVVVFYVLARYRFPVVPVVILFAAAGLLGLLGRLAAREWGSLLRVLPIPLAVGVVVNWPLTAATSPRATTYYNLGVALLERGEEDEARRMLERTLELLPDLRLARRSLADIHFGEADRRAQRGERAQAIAGYRRGLELDPGRAQAHANLGSLLIQAGDLEGAARHLQRALTLDPRQARAHNLLGNLFAERGQLEDAVRHYEQAVGLDSGLADAHYKLGLLLAQAHDLPGARRHLEDAVRLLPDFPGAHRQLGEVLERQGLPGEAAESYRRARELERGGRSR